MKQTNRVSGDDAIIFDTFVAKWQHRLNLGDWRIERGSKPARKGAMATVEFDDGARLATYKLGDFGSEKITPLSLDVKYDARADVLYVALGAPVPAETDIDEAGLLVRYAESDGHPCGVTIMGFRSARWAHDVARLSALVAGHLSVPTKTVSRALGAVSA